MTRFLRRCRAVPSFFSYQLFEEIDALKATVDKLNDDLDTEIIRHAKIEDEDAKDRISWINIAKNQ